MGWALCPSPQPRPSEPRLEAAGIPATRSGRDTSAPYSQHVPVPSAYCSTETHPPM